MPQPAVSRGSAYLILEAGRFEFLLSLDLVRQVVELPSTSLAIPRGRRRSYDLGEATLPDGRTLRLYSLAALAGETISGTPEKEIIDVVEVSSRGEIILLCPDRVGSIEEYPLEESVAAPALLWTEQERWCERGWPGGDKLRWEFLPDNLNLR